MSSSTLESAIDDSSSPPGWNVLQKEINRGHATLPAIQEISSAQSDISSAMDDRGPPVRDLLHAGLSLQVASFPRKEQPRAQSDRTRLHEKACITGSPQKVLDESGKSIVDGGNELWRTPRKASVKPIEPRLLRKLFKAVMEERRSADRDADINRNADKRPVEINQTDQDFATPSTHALQKRSDDLTIPRALEPLLRAACAAIKSNENDLELSPRRSLSKTPNNAKLDDIQYTTRASPSQGSGYPGQHQIDARSSINRTLVNEGKKGEKAWIEWPSPSNKSNSLASERLQDATSEQKSSVEAPSLKQSPQRGTSPSKRQTVSKLSPKTPGKASVSGSLASLPDQSAKSPIRLKPSSTKRSSEASAATSGMHVRPRSSVEASKSTSGYKIQNKSNSKINSSPTTQNKSSSKTVSPPKIQQKLSSKTAATTPTRSSTAQATKTPLSKASSSKTASSLSTSIPRRFVERYSGAETISSPPLTALSKTTTGTSLVSFEEVGQGWLPGGEHHKNSPRKTASCRARPPSPDRFPEADAVWNSSQTRISTRTSANSNLSRGDVWMEAGHGIHQPIASQSVSQSGSLTGTHAASQPEAFQNSRSELEALGDRSRDALNSQSKHSSAVAGSSTGLRSVRQPQQHDLNIRRPLSTSRNLTYVAPPSYEQSRFLPSPDESLQQAGSAARSYAEYCGRSEPHVFSVQETTSQLGKPSSSFVPGSAFRQSLQRQSYSLGSLREPNRNSSDFSPTSHRIHESVASEHRCGVPSTSRQSQSYLSGSVFFAHDPNNRSEFPPFTPDRNGLRSTSYTVFAGKGWISPHPLSRSPTDLAASPEAAIHFPAVDSSGYWTMTYNEWKAIQGRDLTARRNVAPTGSTSRAMDQCPDVRDDQVAQYPVHRNISTTTSSSSRTSDRRNNTSRFSGMGSEAFNDHYTRSIRFGVATSPLRTKQYRPPMVESDLSNPEMISVMATLSAHSLTSANHKENDSNGRSDASRITSNSYGQGRYSPLHGRDQSQSQTVNTIPIQCSHSDALSSDHQRLKIRPQHIREDPIRPRCETPPRLGSDFRFSDTVSVSGYGLSEEHHDRQR